MHARTQRLRDLMAAHDLTAADVAAITGDTPQTVRIWRVKSDNRVIPAAKLRLVELTMQASAGTPHAS